MPSDWYPHSQAALITWHNNFSTQAAINGTTLGLTAGEVLQIAADAYNVLIMLDGIEAANAYREALTAYKTLLFNAPADTPTEPVPSAPTTATAGSWGTPPGGWARTASRVATARAEQTAVRKWTSRSEKS